MTPKHFLSFHVEEHFHVPAFDSPMRRRHWDRCESRVEKNTDKILELLAERQVRATFFVLGWVAERHGALIRRIAKQGHEIASHGYAHELLSAQTAKQFQEDIKKSKRILEDLTGESVWGYRAPGYSLTEETKWALPLLVEEGYKYDSSLSIAPDQATRGSVYCRLDSTMGPLWEIPIHGLKMGGVKMPTHGFSMRLLSYRLLRKLLRRAETDRQSIVAHLRAWEVDPTQPRMRGRSWAVFKQYHNLDKVEERLRVLLRDFQFRPLREALRHAAVRKEATFAVVEASQK